MFFRFSMEELIIWIAVLLLMTTVTRMEEIPKEYDFIVKIEMEIKDESLPEYAVNEIYRGIIPINDIIDVCKIQLLTLKDTENLLKKLRYDPKKVMNVESFEAITQHLNISFGTTYKVLIDKLNGGRQVKEFLESLGFNLEEFALAYTIGDDQRSWELVKQADFSKTSLSNALLKLGKNVDDLFVACRDLLIESALISGTDAAVILKKFNVEQNKFLLFWKLQNITRDNLWKAASFNKSLEDLRLSLKNPTMWGVLTDSKRVATNKIIIEMMQRHLWIGNIVATSISSSSALSLIPYKYKVLDNVLLVGYEEKHKLPRISYKVSKDHNLKNCQYVTIFNGTFLTENVIPSSIKNNSIEIECSHELSAKELIIGSPLLCDSKVYGLARKIESNRIIFDTFFSSTHCKTGGNFISLFSFLLCLLLS